MSDDKKLPTHRVSFARFNRDAEGKSKLGPAREIGAIWPREGKDSESILRFDHIPEEMRNGGGVLFVRTIDSVRGQRFGKSKDTDRER